MDLNLYLGPARPVPPLTADLGSDLALGSAPAPASDEMSTTPPAPTDDSDELYDPFNPFYDRSLFADGPAEDPNRHLDSAEREPEESLVLGTGDPLEAQLRGVIESNLRFRPVPFRSASPEPDASACGFKYSELFKEALEEEEEEKSRSAANAANFECNVCLDMAKEPVVTSCGHLFCWPCLYQWLHVHSDHKECPVCKGEVMESNITPIYGRGSSQGGGGDDDGKEVAGNGIPPRPRGNRLESFRQKHHLSISRRFGEGIATSWRRLVSQQIRSRNSGLFSDASHQAFSTRMRERRMSREGMSPESGHEADETGMPRQRTHIPQTSEGNELWNRFSIYGLGIAGSDRLAALAADFGRVVRSGNRNGASTSSLNPNPSSPEQAIPSSNVATASGADQASASSTLAVIQGEVGVVEGSGEPNSAGSSMSYGRRERSSASESLDVDEGFLHAQALNWHRIENKTQ
ncbi:uncharacterized protein M6B38_321745 [Iris pallida]|uniref:E3 ubiquitin-protein ligase RMA n=1 Tax=Iris pallida TaxID=29817 RepID=A0AAX6HB47_IRIPA|nr:uncharacterized protein M6B38_321745 [Iris pallida]